MKEVHHDNVILTFSQTNRPSNPMVEFCLKSEIILSSEHESKAHQEMVENLKNIKKLETKAVPVFTPVANLNVKNKRTSVSVHFVEGTSVSPIKRQSVKFAEKDNFPKNKRPSLKASEKYVNAYNGSPLQNPKRASVNFNLEELNKSSAENSNQGIPPNKRFSIGNLNYGQELNNLKRASVGTIISDDLHNLVKYINSSASTNVHSKAYKKWMMLSHVLRFIYKLKNINAEMIISMTDLNRSIQSISLQHSKRKSQCGNSMLDATKLQENIINIPNQIYNYHKPEKEDPSEVLDKIKKQEDFFNHLRSGNEEHFETIISNIEKDPNRFIFSVDRKEMYFVNQRNPDGFTPLCVVVINGHFSLAKLLIDRGADHLMKNLKSRKDPNSEENLLETCLRWKMNKIFEYFINELSWPKGYLEAALEVAESLNNASAIKDLKYKLKKIKDSKRKCCKCFFD